MASVIKPKRSSVANTPPTTSNIQQYEIAINTADKKIYTRDGSDSIIVIGSGNISGLGDVAVSSPTEGQILSFDTATNKWLNIDNYATQVKEIVKNNTGGTLVAGTVVYVSGASGANILVAKAQANSEATSSRTFGIIESDILNGASGYCVRSGKLSGLNTSAYTEGDPIYLSPTVAGGFVVGLANKPSAPNHLVYIGVVTRSQSQNGEIQISISNGWEIYELHDVQISNPANGQLLIRDQSAGVWKNAQLSSGSDINISLGAGSVTVSNTSTLASVTARGASTSNAVAITNTTASTDTGTGALTVSGGVGVGGSIFSAGNITSNTNLVSNFSAGDEGGEITLAKPQTNSSINTSITIDIYQNKLRIFESGGSNRGVYVDLTAAAGGVGTNLLNGSGDTTTTVTKSLTLSTDWQDTGIKSTDLATGTYIVQLIANDIGSGGTNNNEYYSGTMSWYSGTTNSAVEMPTDEIVLHRAGASGEGALYLRTYRTPTGDPDNLKLQIYSNTANASAANYVFKFRRMI